MIATSTLLRANFRIIFKSLLTGISKVTLMEMFESVTNGKKIHPT